MEYRDAQIMELRNEAKALAGRLADQENMVFTRNSEVSDGPPIPFGFLVFFLFDFQHVNRLQQEIKHLTDIKDAEIRKLCHTIKTLQDTVDYLTKENFTNTEKYR